MGSVQYPDASYAAGLYCLQHQCLDRVWHALEADEAPAGGAKAEDGVGHSFGAEPYSFPGVLLVPAYRHPHTYAGGKIDGPKANLIHYRGHGEYHASLNTSGIPQTLVAISCGYVNKVYLFITHG
ncbi:hypothetical protein ES708_05273 [subsurface metagenome]